MSYEDILGVVPAIQSADLISRNSPKKKKKKKLVKQAVDNIIGVNLIRETAKYV